MHGSSLSTGTAGHPRSDGCRDPHPPPTRLPPDRGPHAGGAAVVVGTIVAVDVGANGALAFLTDGGALIGVFDMPSVTVKVGKTNRTRVAEQALALLIAAHQPVHAYVEQVGPMPTDGSQQAFGMGLTYGIVRGVIAALGIPVTYTTPGVWKRAMGVTSDKGNSRRRTMELYPVQARDFERVKDDGRAEAVLIGLHGLRMHQAREAA